MKCWECGKDGFESKKSLRMHQISSNEYDKDEFNEKIEQLQDTTESEQGQEEESESLETDADDDVVKKTNDDKDKDEESPKLEDVSGGMESTDLDKLVEESQDGDNSDESDVEQGSTTDKKGLDTAINNAWGRLATIDLDPEDDETTNMRKNIQGLAEDVGLGHNAKWYYEEELKGDTDDPKKAVMGSLLLATVMTLSVRPELAQKIQKEMKNRKSNKSQQLEDNNEEDE